MVVRGRSHLNASAMIKTIRDEDYHLTVLRRAGAVHQMAVTPGYKVSGNGLPQEEMHQASPALTADTHWPPHPSKDELVHHPQVKTAHLYKVSISHCAPSSQQHTKLKGFVL